MDSDLNVGTLSGLMGNLRVGDNSPIRIMGVINLTSNSFYSGSVRKKPEDVLETALKMEEEGANVIDIGARSTAPYRTYDISTRIEQKLLVEAIKVLIRKINIPISVDTTRSGPAKAALDEGATILNDAFGLTQKDGHSLAALSAEYESSLIITAHEIRPKSGGNPIDRVKQALERSVELAISNGVQRRRIIIDPGIGFFSDKQISNIEWNCTVLSRLSYFRSFRFPICVGVSRKRFIGILVGNKPAEQRMFGSLAATAIAVYNGCHIIRTHDVAETLQAVRVAAEIRKQEKGLSHIRS